MRDALVAWLSPVDNMPLECDGLSRVVSTLLHRAGIEHRVRVGSLGIEGVGRISIHWWVELPDGTLVDYRARMWLGTDPRVPHGVFAPELHHRYAPDPDSSPDAPITLSATLFQLLSGRPLASYPRLQAHGH